MKPDGEELPGERKRTVMSKPVDGATARVDGATTPEEMVTTGNAAITKIQARAGRPQALAAWTAAAATLSAKRAVLKCLLLQAKAARSDADVALGASVTIRRVPASPASVEALVHANMALVIRCAADVAARYHGQVQARELLGPGTIALYEAAATYRADLHPSFSHYARNQVRGRMHRAIRTDRPPLRSRAEQGDERVSAHLDEPDPFDVVDERPGESAEQDGLDMLTATLVAGLEADAESRTEGATVDRLALRREVAKLPRREQELLELLYVQELTLVEAVKKLRLTLRTAHRRHLGVLEMLRVALGMGEKRPRGASPATKTRRPAGGPSLAGPPRAPQPPRRRKIKSLCVAVRGPLEGTNL
jgi:RNA polymerase sigma factor (sigma-70 family)